MKNVPLTPNCRRIIDKRDHACIGISPFNSFFSETKMRTLFDWAGGTFDSFNIFLPDTSFVHTLEALGYSRQKAEKKVDKQIRWLRNKIYRALEVLQLSPQGISDIILDFCKLSKNACYQERLKEVRLCFENDGRFRRDCLDASAQVLRSKTHEEITMDQKLKAVEYLLTEIPVISGSREICGSKSSVFCYHQSMPLFTNLFSGVYEYKISSEQAYLVIDEEF